MRSPNHRVLTVASGVLAIAAAIFYARTLPAVAPASSALAPAKSASAPPGLRPSASPSASASAGTPGVPPLRELPSGSDATNSCVACHATLNDPKLHMPAREHRASAHHDDRIGCVGCHRGDPRDPTVGAHGKANRFIAHPTHAEIPEICGDCHSDAGYMRHLNARLPVGQAALFALSLHGKLTAAGDKNAPSCADCHGKHDIHSPSSPRSPTNRANVAKLCSSCHSDPIRMAKYQLPTDQFAKWDKSVHGEAFRKGNPNAPTCNGCHGAHAATPPEAASVAHACGRCHDDELEYFEQSPHSKGFRSRGLSECAACHGTHDIATPTAVLVGTTPDSTCMKCHSKDEKPRKVAEQIAELLRGARDRAAEARAAVARTHATGLHVAGTSFAIDKIATAELKLRGVVHSLDPARLETLVATVDEGVNEAKRLVNDAEESRKNERRGYFVAFALAAALFVSLVLKSIQLDRRRRAAP